MEHNGFRVRFTSQNSNGDIYVKRSELELLARRIIEGMLPAGEVRKGKKKYVSRYGENVTAFIVYENGCPILIDTRANRAVRLRRLAERFQAPFDDSAIQDVEEEPIYL